MARQNSQAGFSLAELVVSVGILTVIMAATFRFVTSSQKTFDDNQLRAEAHQNADFAALRVTEILRGAGANPANDTTINKFTFLKNTTAGDTTSVTALADLNGDKDANDDVPSAPGTTFYIVTAENVTISLNATAKTIEWKKPNETAVTIAENILGFNAEILDNSQRCRLTIVGGPSRALNVNDPRYQNAKYTVVSEFRLRNRN